MKKKTKKQIIPNSGKIEKNQENKKLVVDLDLLDPKLFSSLQGNRSQRVLFFANSSFYNTAAKLCHCVMKAWKSFKVNSRGQTYVFKTKIG